jgi:catechol 2,3-dioxygenase-like lactoylglutathione lyase family enzyme
MHHQEVVQAGVQGLGGVFIYSLDATRLAQWYQTVLGIDLEPHPDGDKYFKVFFTRDATTSLLRENPVFAIYQANGPLATQGRSFTLNLRVQDLDRYLAQLRAQGVEIEPERLAWARGKHAWIRDLDGNHIELYEELLTGK